LFFSETLRKYPAVPILNRECIKTYKLPDTDIVLEKGILTVIPVLALHHDPKYYPDPERFDPERFSEEEKAKRHHYVYLPFGEGPRICIGMFNPATRYTTIQIILSVIWKDLYAGEQRTLTYSIIYTLPKMLFY
jgi:cytochrome P450